jgi:hypothetical protein
MNMDGQISRGFLTGYQTGGRFSPLNDVLTNFLNYTLARRQQQEQYLRQLQTGMMGSMIGAGYQPPAGFMQQMGLEGWKAPKTIFDYMSPEQFDRMLREGRVKQSIDSSGKVSFDILPPLTPKETIDPWSKAVETYQRLYGGVGKGGKAIPVEKLAERQIESKLPLFQRLMGIFTHPSREEILSEISRATGVPYPTAGSGAMPAQQINPQLQEFVRKAKAEGWSDDEIIAYLQKKGW